MLLRKETSVIRTQFPALLVVVAMFAMLLIATPACSSSTRGKTIHATLVAVNAARDGFVSWDRQHQQDLVAAATFKDEARASIDVYRTRRELVVASFEVVYRAIAVAATQSDEISLTAALARAGELYAALKQIGVP
jgi:hypothetical protein